MGTLLPDTIFGKRYRIISLIGTGGMGQVYRAEHLGLRREVALKILRARTTPDFEARFEREARAIARLDHPSCVRVLDHGRATERQFIAMELLEGPTLAEALRTDGRWFSTARAVNVARNLLAGIAHAHGQGVLHRDVKPENVVLVTRGVPRTVLIDFGLAFLRDESALTGSGLCVGSPAYVAPERLLGKSCDGRVDVYAVGVLLYEMLTGIRPFRGNSIDEIMQNVLDKPPRPLRAIRRDVGKELEAVIVRAMAKDPAKRFAYAEDMIAALEEVPVEHIDREALRSITASVREEQETTLANLAVRRQSFSARVWSWLRYGRWRWPAVVSS